MEPNDNVAVRCQNVECRTDYYTILRAFRAQGCCCPKCGSSKAQLRENEADPKWKDSES
jgi:hypothetical protein